MVVKHFPFFILEFAWVMWEWAGMRVHAFGEKDAYDCVGRESCLVTLNHRGELDWLVGCTFATRYNFMHVSISRWSLLQDIV